MMQHWRIPLKIQTYVAFIDVRKHAGTFARGIEMGAIFRPWKSCHVLLGGEWLYAVDSRSGPFPEFCDHSLHFVWSQRANCLASHEIGLGSLACFQTVRDHSRHAPIVFKDCREPVVIGARPGEHPSIEWNRFAIFRRLPSNP